jgi:hypothetical protein
MHRFMLTRLTSCLVPLLLVLLPATLLAQPTAAILPYDLALVKPEPGVEELDTPPSFTISVQVQGMKGLNGIVLWVTADKKALRSYQGNQLMWETDVTAAHPSTSGRREIQRVVSQSAVPVIFVFMSGRCYAEVDRKTGRILATGVDPD